jgi:hypothetical protein
MISDKHVGDMLATCSAKLCLLWVMAAAVSIIKWWEIKIRGSKQTNSSPISSPDNRPRFIRVERCRFDYVDQRHPTLQMHWPRGCGGRNGEVNNSNATNSSILVLTYHFCGPALSCQKDDHVALSPLHHLAPATSSVRSRDWWLQIMAGVHSDWLGCYVGTFNKLKWSICMLPFSRWK